MGILPKLIILLIALLHGFILWIEMFRWESLGKKIVPSGIPSFFSETKAMAANQGLYNGFIAAGLLWSLTISDPAWQIKIALFFLGCVFIAGVYGAITASKSIFWKQGLPALLGIILVLFL